MTESRVRAQIAVWTIDSLGTDPASADRAFSVARGAHAMISQCTDPDVDVAHRELDEAECRWLARLCSEDTGPCEKMSVSEPCVPDDTTT